MAEANSTASAGSSETAQRPLLRRVQGIVASDKGDKTIKVVVNYQMKHPKYGKYLKRQQKFQVHDEKNQAKAGDRVEIAPCRPLSKTKSYRLVRVVEVAPTEA